MEKRFKYLLGLAKHTENYLMYNELKELKKDILKYPNLRIDAMEKRIEELEYEKEFLTANYESLKNYYGQN